MVFFYLNRYLMIPRSEVNVLIKEKRDEKKDEERR